MPLIDIELGITIPWNDTFVKPLLTIKDLDPSVDIDPQINVCLEAANVAFVRISDQLIVSISEIISREGSPGYVEKVDELTKELNTVKATLNKAIKILKESGLAEQVNGKEKEGNRE